MARATLVLTTFGRSADALQCARTLVDERLAACVNILPEIQSVYRWQGAVQAEAEVLCVIKTIPGRAAALGRRLAELHPYEVPEMITLSGDAIHPPYAAWLNECVRAPEPAGGRRRARPKRRRSSGARG
jgi:periplasmic divalent cation tolerance protein